ncbi:MAG: putative 7-carboxy-7-deazaguanine synthase QueE [Clostridia bacterium]|nr:putative 7-carboxy-7-deazaguanine synthase QueE [Clostridia bacterium]
MQNLSVAEKFVSINGEGRRVGELAVFLRFSKCNLQCSFCDTRWANSDDLVAQEMSVKELADYVISTGIQNVTLTGGEPLLQKSIGLLISQLISLGLNIEVETNGSVPLKQFLPFLSDISVTMDYKLPGSGMEKYMYLENFSYLKATDTVKFVAGDFIDLTRAEEIIRTFDLTSRCCVYFSPVFGKIHPEEIVSFMKEHTLNKVRLQLQLHKYIWNPEKRGV